MTKADRRVRRTQRGLSDALMELASEQGYESISIRELTERARVGYATFFRHYKSKDELLLAMLTELIDDFIALLPEREALDGAEQNGLILFRYVGEHTDLCRLLLGSQGSISMSQQLRRLATDATVAALEPLLELPPTLPMEVLANHVVSGIFGLVRWWLDQERPYPPEAMAGMYEQLIFVPLYGMRRDGAA